MAAELNSTVSAGVATGREAIEDAARAAAPWVRLGLTEAQRAAGMAFDRAGNIVARGGVVIAKAGADAARFTQEGLAAATRGAAFAQRQAAAVVEAGTPYVMRGLSEAQKAAGMAVDEAGNVVNAAGVVLAKAGEDAAKLAAAGAIAARTGAELASQEAQALVRAGSPYVMQGLSEAQKAAGLAINASGAVVNRAGVIVAAAGEDAARLAHEGAVYAAKGGAEAIRQAKFVVSAASPYAAQALSSAQVAAGVCYNKGGQLINEVGQFVNPAGAVITHAAAQAQVVAAQAAAIALPAAAVALTEAQRAAGLAYNAAGYLVNNAGTFVNQAGEVISEGAAQAQQAAELAAPFAAQAAAAVVAGAIAGAGEAKEIAGRVYNAAAPVAGAAAAAIGSAAAAGFGEVKDVASSAGAAIAGAGVDVYNSELVRNVGAIAWDGIDDAYTMSREAIAVAMAAVSGVGVACFNFIKFDIVRDFFQTIGMFFSSIASEAMLKAKAVWGNLSNLVSIDFSFTFDSHDLLLAVYVLIAIVAIALLIAFIWFVCTANSLQSNSARDGYESTTWEEIAEKKKKTLKALRYILTAITSAYLPVSRTVFQILACDKVIVSLAVKAGFSVEVGKCWDWTPYVYFFIGALVLLGGFVIFIPVFVYKKIKENIPRGSERDANIKFDEDGEEQEYTDEMYNMDVLRQAKVPYQFLYKGYERKWAYYKVLVMVIKLCLVLPIIFLSQHPLTQSAVTLIILLIFSGLSTYASPFISPEADRMDMSGRITTFLTVLFGLIATNEVAPSTANFMGILINVLNTINAMIMIVMVLIGLKFVKLWIKNKTGRLEFSDTSLDISGPMHKIFPRWIVGDKLIREAKHRIWHPFWDSVMLKLCGDDVAKRLLELQDICRNEGKQRIKAHYLSLQVPGVAQNRAWVQQELEGVDVFWNGVSRDGHNDSKTFFGKMYVKPFPFLCVMVYDDAEDEADVEPKDFAKFVQLNNSPEIKGRRERRRMLRGLNGCTVHLEFSRMETHSVPDGTETYTDAEGNTKERERRANVQVLMHYHRGVLRVRANTKKAYAAGFKCGISYSDGHGTARAPHTGQMHEVNGSCSIGHSEMGIVDSFELTPRLRELLYAPANRSQWEAKMRPMMLKDHEYRRHLIEARIAKEKLLSSDFWLNIYDDFAKDRRALTAYLANCEVNPIIKALPVERREGLDFLYHRLRYVLSHPCCLLWFVFFDDLYSTNKDMKVFKGHEADFDPNNSSSVVYRPKPRPELEKWLTERGLFDQGGCCGRAKLISPAMLDMFYAEMDRRNGEAKAARAGAGARV